MLNIWSRTYLVQLLQLITDMMDEFVLVWNVNELIFLTSMWSSLIEGLGWDDSSGGLAA
jgi:hypothetical protein